MSWTNPYGNILGTFGNPNFIGSFLGIFFSVVLAYGISSSSPKWLKILLIPILTLIAFVIVDSNAIQGRVVAALGTGLVIFFYIRSKFNLVFQSVYSLFAIVLGLLGIAGALQRGPFVEYLSTRLQFLCEGSIGLLAGIQVNVTHFLAQEWIPSVIGIGVLETLEQSSYQA